MKTLKGKIQRKTNTTVIERNHYEPDKNNINKLCRLAYCAHADITSSDVGRIVEVVEDGYGIEFIKKFKNGMSNSYIEEPRVIFGLAKDVILI